MGAATSDGGDRPTSDEVVAVPTAGIRLVLGLVLGGLCGVFLLASLAEGVGSLESVGSGAFPALIAGIGLLTAVAVVIEALRRKGDAGRHVEKPPVASLLRMAGFCAAVALFPLLLRPAGFLIAAWVTSTGVMRAAGQRSWLRCIGYSLVFSAVLFLLFVEWLRVPLPRGPFLS